MAQAQPTTSLDSWNSQNNHVERNLENAGLTSINPEDSLVFVGPPRYRDVNWAGGSSSGNVLVLGLLQQVSFAQGANVQPFKAIGSSRNFFVRDSPPGQFTISRLWTNGRNLLRALYTTAVQNNLDVTALQSPPVPDGAALSNPVYLDLNSELFFMGMGIGIVFGNKTHSQVAAVYLEDAHINGFNTGITSGANATLENVSGVFDRLVPIKVPTRVGGVLVGSSSTTGQAINNMLGIEGSFDGVTTP